MVSNIFHFHHLPGELIENWTNIFLSLRSGATESARTLILTAHGCDNLTHIFLNGLKLETTKQFFLSRRCVWCWIVSEYLKWVGSTLRGLKIGNPRPNVSHHP